MKRTIFLFAMTAILSAGAVVCGWNFMKNQVGEAILTEETITGDRKEADGLVVSFRVDSGDDLHWSNSYDYTTGKTESVFKRGEILEAVEPSIYDDIRRDKTFGKGDLTKIVKTSLYDDIRFTGWDIEPFIVKLGYDRLEGLQEKEIQAFYDELQQTVIESGRTEKGKIRVKDYLDYYPVSFSFRFGSKRLDSGNALTGLKIYDVQGKFSAENVSDYDEDIALYTAFNRMLRIPVIDNEYQEYSISKSEEHDPEDSPRYSAEVKKPSGAGEDYYEFDPIMVIQEETREDGEEWESPNLAGSQRETKNRMLFIVNNRTAKGEPVDVSQISGGYGIYELPIGVNSKTIEIGPRVVSVPELAPLADEISMVYPLDETAEYVEISLSEDHRTLAVFSIKDGRYLVNMIDADTWTSDGPVELFPASEKMTYAWSDDGSLAVTNHEGYVAALCRSDENSSYRLTYNGKAGNDFCEAFFDTEMRYKKNSYAKYQCGIDEGLAITAKDGKIALVQNQTVRFSNTNIRNVSLECAVINETGVIYRGRLNSDIVDMKYDMRWEEKQEMEELLSRGEDSKAANCIVQPVRSENQVVWQ